MFKQRLMKLQMQMYFTLYDYKDQKSIKSLLLIQGMLSDRYESHGFKMHALKQCGIDLNLTLVKYKGWKGKIKGSGSPNRTKAKAHMAFSYDRKKGLLIVCVRTKYNLKHLEMTSITTCPHKISIFFFCISFNIFIFFVHN